MISFISSYSIDVKPYFNALVEQALHGHYSPHGDGWGMVLYDEKEFFLKKGSESIWKVEKPLRTAKSGIFHARKTTSGDVKPSFSHPFTISTEGKDWAFAHNGSIKDFFKPGMIDTQFYFETFFSNLKKNNVIEAMQKTAEEIQKSYQYTSLNVFISNGKEIYAFRIVYDENDDYHSIFYKSDDDLVLFSTEPFGKGWESLRNREFAHGKLENEKVLFEKRRW